MTEKRERRVNQTLGMLNAWAGIGVFGRILLAVAIIATGLWMLKNAIELVLWFRLLG